MRTPEQISNLRSVLFTRVGPFAKLLSDEDIDEFGNNLQQRIDMYKCHWNIKVKMKENKDLSWDNIPFEPTKPYCSVNQIKKKCEELLNKYPKILQLRVCVLMGKEEVDVMIFDLSYFLVV